MKATAIAILLTVLCCPAITGQTGNGTLCVVPNSDKPPGVISPGGGYNPKTLKLRIDKREAVPWPHKQNLKIAELDRTERHLIVIISDGKPIQSTWFRFGDSVELCVSFDGYQGIQVGDAKQTRWCHCK